MNILFSLTYYHPYVSGLTIAVGRWAESLAKRGDRVTVLCMQHEKNLPIVARIRGVFVHRSPWIIRLSKGFLSFDWLISSWRLTGNHDVTVVNLPQFEGIVPALFAKLRGKRVVSIYHCEIELPPGFFSGITQSLVEVSNFLTLLLSDIVITYTKDYADHSRLLTLLTRYKKVRIQTVVPPIPTLSKKAGLTKKLQKQIGLTDVVVGVAARLASEKGVEYLLEAIPLIKSKVKSQKLKVVIAGPMAPVGEEAYRRYIQSLTKKYRRHVVFLGSLAPADMGSFYALLDVLVLPSVNSTEAFGMVQVEAMRQGIPVIASNLPGVRVPIRKTGMGIIIPIKDSHALARAIGEIWNNKKKYVQDERVIEKYFPVTRAVSMFRQRISEGL